MTSARKASIVLLSGNSLCHNPRVMKEAAAFAHAGYGRTSFRDVVRPDFERRAI